MIIIFLNQVFPTIILLSTHNSIRLSPLSFLSPTPNGPIILPTSSLPTPAFKSPNRQILSFTPKLSQHSFNSLQNLSLSSSLAPFTGAYAHIKTHISPPNFTFTHIILELTWLHNLTLSHTSFLITIPTPSLALTLSFTPDIIPLYFPKSISLFPFSLVSVTPSTSNLFSSNINPTSSPFKSSFTPLTFIHPTLITSLLPIFSLLLYNTHSGCTLYGTPHPRHFPTPKATTPLTKYTPNNN